MTIVKAKDVKIGDRMSNSVGPVTQAKSVPAKYTNRTLNAGERLYLFLNGTTQLVAFMEDEDVFLSERSGDAAREAALNLVASDYNIAPLTVKAIADRLKGAGYFDKTS